jgi:hypothetical protein
MNLVVRNFKIVQNLSRWSIAILLFVTSVIGQSTIEDRKSRLPSEEELTASKQMTERLRHPNLVTLRLLNYPKDSKDQPADAPPAFTNSEQMDLRVTITHGYPEALVIWESADPYDGVRPQLLRDGELVPYRKTAQKRLESLEGKPSEGSGAPIQFEPGREYEWAKFRLDQWYSPLQAGRYQLTIQLRFAWEGNWLESSSVIFEIRP